MTQKVNEGKWQELEEIDKKFDVFENRFGFPPKRRYRLFVGGNSMNTLVIERQWESLAQMEAAYEKGMANAEFQALQGELVGIVRDAQIEILLPI